MTSLRAVLPPSLLVGILWFGFYGQRYWMAALGMFDIPGEELFALLFGIAIVSGLVWPGPIISVVVGFAGLVGALTALILTGEIADFDGGRGFSVWWLPFFTAPAAAHAIGTAIYQVRDRRRIRTA